MKDPLLTRYYQKVTALLSNFEFVRVEHIPRSKNPRANVLSKLALGKGMGRFDTVIQVTLNGPTVLDIDCLNIEMAVEDWQTPIIEELKALARGENIPDEALAKKYVFIGEDLYKRGFTTHLMRCMDNGQVEHVMNELHNGVCGMHCGHRTLAAKVVRAGYYWLTVHQDYVEYVKKCKSCQENGPLIHQPPTNLQMISYLWPFVKWGMDIVGPFPPTTRQRRFVIMAVDYFIKWIEVEPLA